MTKQASKWKQTFENAYLEDHEIAVGRVFLLAYYFTTYVTCLFFDMSLSGIERLNRDEPYLFITHHSNHNGESLAVMMLLYKETKKIPRGLIHRVLYVLCYPMRWFGLVPGDRELAVDLLSHKHWVVVIPGGAEEALVPYDKAYNLYWKSSRGRPRRGWAHVAKEANVKVVPVAGRNVQEMYFNPCKYFVNVSGISAVYEQLVLLPGEPLSFKPGESIESFSNRAQEALQKMIHQKNPNGLDYFGALHERLHQSKDK